MFFIIRLIFNSAKFLLRFQNMVKTSHEIPKHVVVVFFVFFVSKQRKHLKESGMSIQHIFFYIALAHFFHLGQWKISDHTSH